MQILGLLGMYFDAVAVFVTSHSHLFRLALAILCQTIVTEEHNSVSQGSPIEGVRPEKRLK